MILTIGDAILDIFSHHMAGRLEPTAPVPVLYPKHHEYMAGGAANVAQNVRTLGGKSRLLGAWDLDEDGLRLESLLKCDFTRIPGQTTVKQRIVADRQVVCRIDRARENTGITEIPEDLIEDTRFVILQDYQHGIVTDELIESLKSRGIPTIVDPKRITPALKGLTYLKPNKHEARVMLGHRYRMARADECAEALAKLWETRAIVTDGSNGIFWYDQGSSGHCPGHQVEVFDVTGAGDTVIAALAVQLERGVILPEAVKFANLAAAAVVRHHGTVAATLDEVQDLGKDLGPLD